MGFLYLAIKIPKVLTISFIVNMLTHLKFVVIGALTHLGLFKPPPEEDYSRDHSNDYILILDGSSPSLVPIPVHVVTASIKRRLPVVTCADFLRRSAIDDAADKLCTICLECIGGHHEVRELYNCSHVFHRDCLDTWVDGGQVTCPLCRSMLLPPKPNLTSRSCGGGGDPASVGAVERDSQLLGEGHVTATG